jgi:hypothetical protein
MERENLNASAAEVRDGAEVTCVEPVVDRAGSATR